MQWEKGEPRRMAASTRAIERSAVFMVPMTNTLGGSGNVVGILQFNVAVSVLEEEVELAETLAKLPRLSRR